MIFLYPFPFFILGFLTYHYWLKLRGEIKRTNTGGEIERIIKLGGK